ncbi:MAG: YigZ family protein [Lachnospiraceae bacterium]|jgi:uncharacterized protein, YigZ family|nr:YigZ family protein [Lachnospiraceae bacterium]
MAGYKIVYNGGSAEIVEKKSRFIANVFPLGSEEEAAGILEGIKKKYWDARHNCYAYVTGGISKCSDDGEPSGTAGRPILEVITGEGISDVLIVVTRYFGGTLLGTGGLVRAYSKSAKEGLCASSIVYKEPGKIITITTDYNGIGKLQYIASQMELAIMDTKYSEKAEMELVVSDGNIDTFVKKVTEATSGQALINKGDNIYFAVIDGKPVVFG